MIGVIFATEKEAAPFLELAGQHSMTDCSAAIFGNPDHEGLFTMISGMGPAAARAAAKRAIAERGARRLVNAGICGALLTEPPWRPGAVFTVSRARTIGEAEGPPTEAFVCETRAWPQLPSADLVTTPVPIFNTRRRNDLAHWGALVDMEGAAIAAVANAEGLPCALIKGITDFAAEGSRADLQRRLAGVSRRIAEMLAAVLIPPEDEVHGTPTPHPKGPSQ